MRILLLEDNPGDVRLVREALSTAYEQGVSSVTCEVVQVDRLARGLACLAQERIDAVLLDLSLPDSQGLATFEAMSAQAPHVPILVLSGLDDESLAVRAVQAGAQDYFVKGRVDGQVLVPALRYAIERQQMRLALQASEARFRTLIAQNADGIVVVDRQSRVCFVNPAAEQLFGRPARALLGETFGYPMVVGETLELCLPSAPGRAVVVEMRVVETEWAGAGAYLASLRDLTPRRDAETLLRQREEQLRQAQKMEAIGRLAGGVAHDFNNLLTAIIGYTDIMLQRLDASNTMYRYVERVSKAADRAALLTRQLLTFSRPQEFSRRLLDVNAIVAEMEDILQPLIGENITLTTVCLPQLGRVQADLGQLQQLVMNLVVNARDAMPQGGMLRIETANTVLTEPVSRGYLGAPAGPYIVLTVSDTGEGMSPETLRHLFEPFFTTKEVGRGTGLGLAVVYGILQQHGGDIEVYSRPGHGTTFKVYLPRCTEAAQETSAAPQRQGVPKGI